MKMNSCYPNSSLSGDYRHRSITSLHMYLYYAYITIAQNIWDLFYSNPPGMRAGNFLIPCKSIDAMTWLNCLRFGGFFAGEFWFNIRQEIQINLNFEKVSTMGLSLGKGFRTLNLQNDKCHQLKKKLIWVCHTVPKIIWSYRFVLAQCQQCTVKKKKKKGKSISVLQYIVHPVRHDVFGRALLKTFIRKSIYILVRIIKCLKFPHILTWPVIIN